MSPKTLRDEFAMAAVSALIQRHRADVAWSDIGPRAYEVADALLCARATAPEVDFQLIAGREQEQRMQAEAKLSALAEGLGLIAAGWEVIESDGSRMTIRAPWDWEEPGDRERVLDATQAQGFKP